MFFAQVMAQVVEHLPSKPEVPSFKLQYHKKKMGSISIPIFLLFLVVIPGSFNLETTLGQNLFF
jgi:hypothetical protein